MSYRKIVACVLISPIVVACILIALVSYPFLLVRAYLEDKQA